MVLPLKLKLFKPQILLALNFLTLNPLYLLGVKTTANVDTIIGIQSIIVLLLFIATYSEVAWVVLKKKE